MISSDALSNKYFVPLRMGFNLNEERKYKYEIIIAIAMHRLITLLTKQHQWK